MARKKKTKETEYAVRYLSETTKMSPTQISLELGLEQAIVEGILDKPKEAKPRKPSKSQDLMIRHTSNKKINNVSIMTEAASSSNEDAMKQIKNKKTKKRTEDSIFRPNG